MKIILCYRTHGKKNCAFTYTPRNELQTTVRFSEVPREWGLDMGSGDMQSFPISYMVKDVQLL
jgi:hypothetical protein